MTNQHPLTDSILISRFPEHVEKVYSPTFDHIADGMRAAADWQLEQVIEWLEETGYDQFWDQKIITATDLKKAMRPQQLEDN